mgnify:CR=1 FL=1
MVTGAFSLNGCCISHGILSALDASTGETIWAYHTTEGDAWNYACEFNRPLRCPDPEGHDFDFGAAPVLVRSLALSTPTLPKMVQSCGRLMPASILRILTRTLETAAPSMAQRFAPVLMADFDYTMTLFEPSQQLAE